MARLNASLARSPSRRSSTASFATAPSSDGEAADQLSLPKARYAPPKLSLSGSIDIFHDASEPSGAEHRESEGGEAEHIESEGNGAQHIEREGSEAEDIDSECSEAEHSDDEASALQVISGNAARTSIHTSDAARKLTSILGSIDVSDSEAEPAAAIIIDDESDEDSAHADDEDEDEQGHSDEAQSPPAAHTPPRRRGHASRSTSLSSAAPDCDSDAGSLADFIVSDSASECELKRPYTPGRRHKAAASAPRSSRRRVVLDSDDEDEACGLVAGMAALRVAKPPFASAKAGLAEAFLAELDRKVTRGAVAERAGAVPIVWSNSLKSTAGSARFKPAAGPMGERRYETTIQLAAGIILSEEQLYNTLAHEFCHVAVFHVDGAARHGHGRLFKRWARKVEARFPAKALQITTRHAYALQVKFAWRCDGCAHVLRRPTRSVDPTKKSCGRCRGRLRQVDVDEAAEAGKDEA